MAMSLRTSLRNTPIRQLRAAPPPRRPASTVSATGAFRPGSATKKLVRLHGASGEAQASSAGEGVRLERAQPA